MAGSLDKVAPIPPNQTDLESLRVQRETRLVAIAALIIALAALIVAIVK